MAGRTTKSRDAASKARVALEAVRGEKTIAQIASEYGVLYRSRVFWTLFLLSHTNQFLKLNIILNYFF